MLTLFDGGKHVFLTFPINYKGVMVVIKNMLDLASQNCRVFYLTEETTKLLMKKHSKKNT